ncbi:MAG: hypothetical protein OCD76_05205 [Reichenbachiella sp.]
MINNDSFQKGLVYTVSFAGEQHMMKAQNDTRSVLTYQIIFESPE